MDRARADTIAAFYADSGEIAINRGAPWRRRKGVAEMASGFFADVPDLRRVYDGLRVAGDHVACLWTFAGENAKTRSPLSAAVWEDWELDAEGNVDASRGWYDAEDYARQVAG